MMTKLAIVVTVGIVLIVAACDGGGGGDALRWEGTGEEWRVIELARGGYTCRARLSDNYRDQFGGGGALARIEIFSDSEPIHRDTRTRELTTRAQLIPYAEAVSAEGSAIVRVNGGKYALNVIAMRTARWSASCTPRND